MRDLVHSFYEQITPSPSQQPSVTNTGTSRSILINMSTANTVKLEGFLRVAVQKVDKALNLKGPGENRIEFSLLAVGLYYGDMGRFADI